MPRSFRVLFVTAVLVLSLCPVPTAAVAGEPAAGPAAQLPTAELAVITEKGRFLFTVEVAGTPEARRQGLMFRRSLGAGRGMVFLFDPPQPVAMWMKDTVIALDMVFISETGRVLNVIENAEPLSLVPRQSKGPARAVLEVGAGTARRIGIAPGDRVQSPALARDGRGAATLAPGRQNP